MFFFTWHIRKELQKPMKGTNELIVKGGIFVEDDKRCQNSSWAWGYESTVCMTNSVNMQQSLHLLGCCPKTRTQTWRIQSTRVMEINIGDIEVPKPVNKVVDLTWEHGPCDCLGQPSGKRQRKGKAHKQGQPYYNHEAVRIERRITYACNGSRSKRNRPWP